jgi:phosphatidate cytidylyltransferase
MTEKNHNLLVRVATAFLLLPLVIFLIWQGGLWFAVLIGAATALCALELNLLPFNQDPRQEQLSAAAIVSVGGAFLMPLLDEVRFGFVSAKLVLAAVLMISFADALLFEEEIPNAPRRVGMAVLGVVYPGLLLSALVRLRQVDRGEWWIILALVVTWWNDTGAYFAGRALGKRKLFPRISPSKTWEGAIGGAAASMVGALLVQHFWLPRLPIWGALLIGAGASVLGPLGDLSESLLKRAFGAKDSGRLLPGHGGMLDRLDALLFTAPFVLLCARLWSNG